MLLTLSCGLSLALAAEGPIPYTTAGGRALTLDVWRPEGPGPRAGVLLIHGGGWKYGDLYEGLAGQAEAAAAAGLVVVSPNYRLSTEAPWPAQREDVACALAWTRAHAGELELDPDRIAAVGHSAGGQLALMLAEAPELGVAEGCGAGGLGAPGAVAAAVSLAGPSDMALFYAETAWWGRKMARELLKLPLTAGADRVAAALRIASPLSYVDALGPPVLQVVGGADPLVPGAIAASFDRALRAAGRASEIVTVPEAGHNEVNRVELWLPWALRQLGVSG